VYHSASSLTQEVQAAHLDSVLRMYATEGDYVMATVLGAATEADANGLLRACPLAARHKCLQRNEFPYQMPDGTRHFVMWYRCEIGCPTPLTLRFPLATSSMPWRTKPKSQQVSGPQWRYLLCADISQALRTRCRSDAFEFVWYLNPKMVALPPCAADVVLQTIPDIFHVQVFWHSR
jgi:hypothetical protein